MDDLCKFLLRYAQQLEDNGATDEYFHALRLAIRRLEAAERLSRAVAVYRANGGGDGRYTAMIDAADAYRELVPSTPDTPADAVPCVFEILSHQRGHRQRGPARLAFE